MEGILGKINVCKNLLQKYKVRFALSPFMTIFYDIRFLFFFLGGRGGGRGLQNFLNLTTRLFEDRYGLNRQFVESTASNATVNWQVING